MKYLIAIDSDGTLRHSDGSISLRTKEVIKKLLDAGNIIVLCTARPRYHALKIANEVSAKNYIISSNGAEIYDVINKSVVFSKYVSHKNCICIYDDAKKLDIRIIFGSEDIEYATKYTRNDSQVLLNDSNSSKLLKNNIKQIMIIGEEKEKIIEYKTFLMDKLNLHIIDSSRNDKEEIWFSVVNSDASKGYALKKLAKHLHIPLKNTIAIGDDNNDISMIDVAGIGVALGNATSELKNHADIIGKTNDEDGVAVFLETLL